MRHMPSSESRVPRNFGAFARALAASLIVALSLLAGTGSAGLAKKPNEAAALPKTPNACRKTGESACKYDVTIVVGSHYAYQDSEQSRKMDASWSVTYKNLPLWLPTAAELALSQYEPEGDIINLGYSANSFTVGKISFSQSGVGLQNCAWNKSYRVPTTLVVNSYLKLLNPIREGRPWSFTVQSYYNKDIGGTGNYCERGNTEAAVLGMPEPLCCRIGGPPTTTISLVESSGQPFFYTKLERDYWTKLGRLQFPWTDFWEGRSVKLSKKWSAQGQSGSVTVIFKRRR